MNCPSTTYPYATVYGATEDVLLGAILRGPALRVVDDERDHTLGRKYSIRPSSDALLSQEEAGRERS
jgi:hypothetical protein